MQYSLKRCIYYNRYDKNTPIPKLNFYIDLTLMFVSFQF